MAELKGALVVPQAATMELQGGYLVAVVGPDNVANPVPVKLGPVQGPMQVITGNVKVGDKVVVGGVEKIRPGLKVNPSPWQPPAPAAKPSPSATPTPKPSPAA